MKLYYRVAQQAYRESFSGNLKSAKKQKNCHILKRDMQL